MRRNRGLLEVGIVLLLAAAPSLAQEANPAPREPVWKGSLGLSYLATSGNTDTSTFGLDFKMERTPEPWGLELVALMNHADESGVTTSERYYGGARAKRALGERWQYLAGVSGERDRFAGFDLRSLVETGVAYRFLIGPTHLLSGDVGVTYTDESRVDPEPDADWLGGLAGLAYEWKISESASLTERLVFYPNFDTSSDWRLGSDTAVQAAISKRLALKLGYEYRYRNQPIGDREGTDTTTKVSLVVNL